MNFGQKTVADALVDTLYAAGVRHIFGVPGDAINEIVEALRKQDKVEFVQVRHEEAGAFAAVAQAKLTGRPAVCVGTAGGGAIHLLNGLYDAKLDHAPVIAITGQVATSDLGRNAHQEINSLALFNDVSVFNEVVVSEKQAPEIFVRAVQVALAQRGVSHLSIPDDIANKKVSESKAVSGKRFKMHRHVADAASIESAAKLIDDAERPLILAGMGALEARSQLLEFAEKIAAPIIPSLRAKELLADGHDLSLGGTGLLGTSAAVEAMEECDLLIMVGTDFPYFDFYPEKAHVVQIDRSSEHIGRRCAVDVGLCGEASETLVALCEKIASKSNADFLADCQRKMRAWRKQQTDKEQPGDNTDIYPQQLAHLIGTHARKDAIFICDTGAVTAWVARHLPVHETQRFLLSGNLASMGIGVGGAIGAKLAFRDRPVIACCGDGGFTMMMQDFITAVTYKLPIVFIIFNNEKLALIKMEQYSRGNPPHKTALTNPDFAKYAEICGAKGWSVNTASELVPALEAAFDSEGPAIVDVALNREEIVVPPKVSVGQSLNYGLAKVKEFVAG